MRFSDVAKRHLGPPVNVEGIVKDLGIQYLEDPFLDENISGELEAFEDGSYRISVNASEHPKRQRFTLAHELGHYLLHAHLIGDGVDDNKAYRSDLDKGNFFNSKIKRRHETEANRFAAQLLMPRRMVLRRSQSGKSVGDLAEEFQVSKAAMEIRLSTLGIVVKDGFVELVPPLET